MNKLIWTVLLSLTAVACGDNSVATKADIDEAIRNASGSNVTVPTESEDELNTRITDLQKHAARLTELKRDPRAQNCVQEDRISYAGTSYAFINKTTGSFAATAEECNVKVNQWMTFQCEEIERFLATYSGGFKLKQKVGNLQTVSNEIFVVDPTIILSLGSSLQ